MSDSDLVIKIRTLLDEGGLKKGTAAVKELKQESLDAGAGLQKMANEIPGLGAGAGVIKEALTSPFAAAAAAIGLAVEALRAYNADSRQNIETQVSFASQQANSAENLEKFSRIVDHLKDTAGLDFAPGLSRLLEAGGDAGNLEGLAKLLEHATARTGNLDSATGKLVESINGEFGQWRRLGITIDERMTQSEKMAELTRALAGEEGRLGQRTQTLGGQMDTLRLHTETVLSGLGELITRVPAVQAGFLVLEGMMERAAHAAEHYFPAVKAIADAQEKQRRSGAALRDELLALVKMEEARALAESLAQGKQAGRLKSIQDESQAEHELAEATEKQNEALLDQAVAEGKISAEAASAQKARMQAGLAGQEGQDKVEENRRIQEANVQEMERLGKLRDEIKAKFEASSPEAQNQLRPGFLGGTPGAKEQERIDALRRENESLDRQNTALRQKTAIESGTAKIRDTISEDKILGESPLGRDVIALRHLGQKDWRHLKTNDILGQADQALSGDVNETLALGATKKAQEFAATNIKIYAELHTALDSVATGSATSQKKVIDILLKIVEMQEAQQRTISQIASRQLVARQNPGGN